MIVLSHLSKNMIKVCIFFLLLFPADEFLLENKVLISGHLLNGATSGSEPVSRTPFGLLYERGFKLGSTHLEL